MLGIYNLDNFNFGVVGSIKDISATSPYALRILGQAHNKLLNEKQSLVDSVMATSVRIDTSHGFREYNKLNTMIGNYLGLDEDFGSCKSALSKLIKQNNIPENFVGKTYSEKLLYEEFKNKKQDLKAFEETILELDI